MLTGKNAQLDQESTGTFLPHPEPHPYQPAHPSQRRATRCTAANPADLVPAAAGVAAEVRAQDAQDLFDGGHAGYRALEGAVAQSLQAAFFGLLVHQARVGAFLDHGLELVIDEQKLLNRHATAVAVVVAVRTSPAARQLLGKRFPEADVP